MIATVTVDATPFQAAEYEHSHGLGKTIGIGDQISILSPAPRGLNGRSSERTLSPATCALCHTQLQEELATLRDRERGKAQYTRMLVHELRAPVAASKSLAAAMRHVRPEDTQVNQVLGRIESRMDQLLDLVNDILQLNGIKTGQPLGKAVDCDLVAETRSICEAYLEEATAKGLSMEVDLPTCPVTIHMVRQNFQLILSNLVSNAVKYTTAGQVEIALRQEGSWAVLEVQDTGIGIPEGEVAQLFTEFFRASNARRSQVPGTGLGLAGVKALVEQSGGDLALQTQENQGSSFTVRLPLHEPQSLVLSALSKAESHQHCSFASGTQPSDAWAA